MPTQSLEPAAWWSLPAASTEHYRRRPIPTFYTQILRTNPGTGAIERPWRMRERGNLGMFVLGDPSHGGQKHHKENAVMVPSYSEALELVRKGFSIRMSDGRSPANLVSPGSLEFVDEPVERLDDLWAYTMPEPSFTLEQVMDELRRHILSQASDLGWIANDAVASAFIGFPFDPTEDSDSSETSDRIDLEQFNITRIVRRAHEAAFRPWPSAGLSEEDADELEQIITGSLTRFPRRDPSPMDMEGSALQRTLLAAYYRWQIIDGCFLASEEIDQSATEAIGALTGMPAAAVRNALSRDGLSLVKSKIDLAALTEWVVTRRNFAPFRQSEQREERWTWRALHELRNLPLQDAFARIRLRMPDYTQDLSAAEAAIGTRREAGQIPSEAELRRYAASLGIAPDNFILELNKHWGGR